jgi:phosphatidylethanolamine-binding protein (PEBP) family uncharacterized protein
MRITPTLHCDLLSGLQSACASAPSSELVMAKNSVDMAYLGPCPPRGNAPQH